METCSSGSGIDLANLCEGNVKFMGTDSNSLIQVRNELKDYGYQITYGLRAQLSGDGVDGDGTLEGN